MKENISKFAILVFLFFLWTNASSASATKWQSMLERNGVPSTYWEKYLPNVSRNEYAKTVKKFLSATGQETESTEEGEDEDDIKVEEGKYPLPETSGKIAKEQHLWLKSGQSAASHYEMTNTPSSCRNGMAGGFGAFGPLGYGDRKEEKYYITMRWGYADWVEPESDLAGALSKTAQTLTVENGKDFAKSGFVKIENEYVKYSSRSKDKLKGLRRGYKSVPASHEKNDGVKQVYRYKGGQWERLTRTLRIDKSKKKWFKEKKVLVENERTGKKVVTSILESGPAIWTNRVGGLSPEAFEAIGAKNNEECTFSYVDEDTKLGKVK